MITEQQIEEAFREWVQDTGEHYSMSSLEDWGGQWDGFQEGAKWALEMMKDEYQNGYEKGQRDALKYDQD